MGVKKVFTPMALAVVIVLHTSSVSLTFISFEKNATSIASLTNNSCSMTSKVSLVCSGPLVTEELLKSILPYAQNLKKFMLFETFSLTAMSKEMFTNVSTRSLVISKGPAIGNMEEGAFSGIQGLESLTLSESGLVHDVNNYPVWNVFKDLEDVIYLNLTGSDLSRGSFSSSVNISILTQLEVLILDSNPIYELGHDIFQPLRNSRIKNLSMSNCKLKYIDPGAFGYLEQLRSLTLDNNPELFSTLPTFSSLSSNLLPSIEHISLAYNEIDSDMKNIIIITILRVCPKLDTLDLSGNYLNPISSSMFINHDALQRILMADCKLARIFPLTFSLFKNLTDIDLTNNFLKSIPESLISPTLQVLKIGRPKLDRHAEDFIILPNISAFKSLKELSFNHLRFRIEKRTDLGGHSPLLRKLVYENCVLHFQDYNESLEDRGALFSSLYPKLSSLSLENTVFLPKYSFKMEDIKAMTHLEDLNLSGISLLPGKMTLMDFAKSRLRRLALRGSLADVLEKYNLPEFKNISEIDLSENEVDTCGNRSHFFDHVRNPGLRRLILRKNRIPFCFKQSMWRLFCDLQYLDMSETIFKCSENISYFYILSLKCPVEIVNFQGGNGYICQDDNKLMPFMNYLNQNFGGDTFMPTSDKVPSIFSSAPLFLISLGLGVLLLFILSLAVARLRSNWLFIKYVISKQNKGFLRHFRSKGSQDSIIGFDFDAFVSYDSQDEPWIENYLLPQVESLGQQRLCIHTRDFVPGKSIAENIAESLERSRKIIILLSDSFVKSKWCRFEYQLAMDFMQRQPSRKLIIIKKTSKSEKLPRMSTDMKLYLLTHTYMEWSENLRSEKERDFWNTLRKSLKK